MSVEKLWINTVKSIRISISIASLALLLIGANVLISLNGKVFAYTLQFCCCCCCCCYKQVKINIFQNKT